MTVYLGKNPVGIGRIVEKKVAKKKYGVTVDTFLGDVDANGILQAPTEQAVINLEGVTSVASTVFQRKFQFSNVISFNADDIKYLTSAYCCDNAFRGCTQLKTMSMSKIETINASYACNEMFMNCSNLETGNLGNLTGIQAGNACTSMFNNCSKLTTVVGLNKIKIINGGSTADKMFYKTNINIANLSSLETISGYRACYYMFAECKNLVSIILDNLQTITGSEALYRLLYNTKITTLSFPSLTSVTSANAMQYMCSGCTTITEIHFRADMQATVEALTGYSSRFGAPTTCTIYFSL